MMTIGQNLKAARRRKCITMREAARIIGIPFRSYQGYELDKNIPNVLTAYDLACFCGITLEELIGIERKDREKE